MSLRESGERCSEMGDRVTACGELSLLQGL